MTKFYYGRRIGGTATVQVVAEDGQKIRLDPRLDLENRSPTGFEWGYGGSGPAQLALALIADATGDDGLAIRMHQPFKWAVTAKLDRDAPWCISDREVRAKLDQLQHEEEAT